MVTEYTPNFNIPLPEFDKPRWQDEYYTGMRIIDAVIGQYVTANSVRGVWTNSTAYADGDTVVDSVDGSIYQVVAAHTSPPIPTTFAQARLDNTNLWSLQGLQERFRGTWISGVLYGTGDFVVSGHIYAVAVAAHTSGGSFAADISNWDYLIDLTADMATIAADKVAAAASASSASTSASTATTQAGISTTQAGISTAQAAVIATAQAVIATAQAVLTAADRVQTGIDAAAADADATATAADRVQTGLDRTSATNSAAAAAASLVAMGSMDLTGAAAADDVIMWDTGAAKYIRKTFGYLTGKLNLLYQALSTRLTSLAGFGTANTLPYLSAADTYSTIPFNAAARSGIAALALGTVDRIIYTSSTATFAMTAITAGGRALINVTGAADAVPYYTSSSAASTFASTSGGRAFMGLTGASDLLGYFTGASSAATTAFTSLARTLIGRATAALMRTDLGAAASGANTDITSTSALTSMNGGQLAGLRNKFINGDFNIWQRGTTFTSIADNTYTADRWLYRKSGAVVHDVLRSTDVPSVAQMEAVFGTGKGYVANYSIHLDVTTVDAAIAASDYCVLQQKIEGYNWASLAAKPTNVSFWVKAAKTGIHCAGLTNAGFDRSYVFEYTINVADTWEYKTVAILASPLAGTWDYTFGIGATINFAIVAGSTYQVAANAWQTGNFFATSSIVNEADSTANNFKVHGVQIESGTAASLFESLLFGFVLGLCERYYQKTFPYTTAPAQNLGTANGAICAIAAVATTQTMGYYWKFSQHMRTTPTIITYNFGAANANWRSAGAADVTVSVDPDTVKSDSGVLIYSSGALTVGARHYIQATADAEL